MAYAKYYYKTLAQLPEYGDFDIIGHFDLIMKHSDNITFFDASSKEYINAAIEAMEALKGKIRAWHSLRGGLPGTESRDPGYSVISCKHNKMF